MFSRQSLFLLPEFLISLSLSLILVHSVCHPTKDERKTRLFSLFLPSLFCWRFLFLLHLFFLLPSPSLPFDFLTAAVVKTLH